MRLVSKPAAATTLLLLALSATTFVLERPAMGAPERRHVEAVREHTKKGYTLYQVGKYLEASLEFEQAYAVRPEAGLLYNAAQSARLGGDLRKAQTMYSSYISFHPDGENLADARSHLEKIEVAIKAEDEARRAAATSITSRPATTTSTVDEPVVQAPRAQTPARAPQRSDRPLYKRWWFWTAIAGGAVVLATSVTLGVVLTRPAPSWNNVPDLGPGAPATMNTMVRLRF